MQLVCDYYYICKCKQTINYITTYIRIYGGEYIFISRSVFDCSVYARIPKVIFQIFISLILTNDIIDKVIDIC